MERVPYAFDDKPRTISRNRLSLVTGMTRNSKIAETWEDTMSDEQLTPQEINLRDIQNVIETIDRRLEREKTSNSSKTSL